MKNIFKCPECSSVNLDKIEQNNDYDFLTKKEKPDYSLKCKSCRREYPVFGSLFVFWTDDIKQMYKDENREFEKIDNKVKQANITIYQDVSQNYSSHHNSNSPYGVYLKSYLESTNKIDENPDNQFILDIGCSSGEMLTYSKNSGIKNIFGADISFNNLLQVKEKGFNCVLCDAENLPFQDKVFSIITCIATLHHLPNPVKFYSESFRTLVNTGVLLVGGEPTKNSTYRSFLGEFIWNMRLPIYSLLSKFSQKFYMHRNRVVQEINDLAEFNRTKGGFSIDELNNMPLEAGFHSTESYFGIKNKRFEIPPLKIILLKIFSLRNPMRPINWQNLSVLAVKENK